MRAREGERGGESEGEGEREGERGTGEGEEKIRMEKREQRYLQNQSEEAY